MFYVYTHWHYDTGVPVCFWVGKGCRDRAWRSSGRNAMWQKIVAKHGCDVRIVQECETEEEAFGWEKTFITLFGRRDRRDGTLVNFTDGGEGASGYKHTPESKVKLAAARVGYKYSQQTKDRIAKANSQRVVTSETRAKLAVANIGKILSAEVRSKISVGGRGKKRSPETRMRMAEAARNRTPEHREKLLLARRARI